MYLHINKVRCVRLIAAYFAKSVMASDKIFVDGTTLNVRCFLVITVFAHIDIFCVIVDSFRCWFSRLSMPGQPSPTSAQFCQACLSVYRKHTN